MTRSNKKIVTPANPLIYKVAAEMAGVFFDAGRSSGLQSKHKTPEAFARANIEKFLPKAVQTLIEMLKPTSNCTEHMREEIYSALMDPVNDPNLMQTKPQTDDMVDDAIKAYDKNQIKFKNLITPKTSYKDKLLNTANPLTPKPN